MNMDSDSVRSDSSVEFGPHNIVPPYLAALSTPQRASLVELRRLCVAQDVYWHSEKGKGLRPVRSNDSITLLRFLKARGYNAQAAIKQYSATVAWRRKLALDDLYLNTNIPHYEAISRLFPQWTGRRSYAGVPLFAYRIPRVKQADLLATSKADPGLTSVFLPAEYSTQFVQPLCARMHPDRAMPCLMHIVDLTGVGVRHFWNMKTHLQKLSTMATSHYPEAVDKIFIIGAPSFFPTIWGYINKWFEPNLTSKIFVLSASEAYVTLTKYIDPEDLPIFAGGNLDWDYGMQPNLDTETRSLVGSMADNWVEGPLQIVSDNGVDKIVQVGNHTGRSRHQTLVEMRRLDGADSDGESA